VDEIVAELKMRMKQRGDTGNIQRAEATLDAVVGLRTEVRGRTEILTRGRCDFKPPSSSNLRSRS